jgi:hypothetical protein
MSRNIKTKARKVALSMPYMLTVAGREATDKEGSRSFCRFDNRTHRIESYTRLKSSTGKSKDQEGVGLCQ